MSYESALNTTPSYMVRILLFVCTLIAMTACSSSGDSDDDGSKTFSHFNVPVSSIASKIAIEASDNNQIGFTYDVPVTLPPITDLNLDLNALIKHVSLDIPVVNNKSGHSGLTARALETVMVEAYIASGDVNTEQACLVGEKYGPFSIQVDGEKLASVSPASVMASKPSLSIYNKGSFTICFKISSPFAASVSVSNVEFDAVKCEEQAEDISGYWFGQYSCKNSGIEDDGGEVSLTITQNGHSAHYVDDSGAVYDGTVCGNIFEYSGGVELSYEEAGKFILGSNNKATKTSTWKSLYDQSQGSCSDSLQRSTE